MPEDWAAVALEVADALDEVGFDVVLKGKAAKTGPVYAPTITPPLAKTVRAMSIRRKSMAYVTPSQKQFTDLMMVEAVANKVPGKDDTMTVRGKDMIVVEVQPVAPGGVDLYYLVWLAA